MATKSSNLKGNPYHDENDGRFTSPNEGNAKEQNNNISNGIQLKPGVNLGGLKLKEGKTIESLAERLKDLNQTSNVPKLTTARDIESHITEFFSKQVIGKIDELYGKSTDCASYQFHPKSNPHMTLEIFPNVLGKYRYKDNHAKIVSAEEFDKLKQTWNGDKIFRGISSNGLKAQNIVNSYGIIDLNNFDYYCPNGGNVYGSNIYTTVSRSYALSYSGYKGTLIEGLLDSQNSWSMTYNQVKMIMSKINQNQVLSDVSNHLEKNGLDSQRAQRIANSFSKAIKSDPGIVAILMGLDYYIADNHQRNLFNLSKWIIREV